MAKEKLIVKAGEELLVELESYSGGGYSWEVDTDQDYLSLKDRIKKFDSEGAIGGGAREQFVFLSHKKGEGTITFKLKRVWEEKPERVIEYNISIR